MWIAAGGSFSPDEHGREFKPQSEGAPEGRLLGKTANFVRDDDGWRDSRRGINEGGGQMKQRSEQRSQQFREVYLAKQEDASATAPDSFRRGDIRGRCRGYA